MENDVKLVVCWMVEGDEDVWKLSYESVKGHADHYVVINGSGDDGEGFPVNSYVSLIDDRSNFEEIWSPYPHDDKGADGKQRNKYLQHVKEKFPGAWVLVLDADEFVDNPEQIREFARVLQENRYDSCSPSMRHFVWNLACEDATIPEHYVPLRLFKVKDNLSYPEVEHNVLQGCERMTAKSPFVIWHLGYAREVMRLKKKYFNHKIKSNIHSEGFLTWWYHAHLFGEYPTKSVPRHELPAVLKNHLGINEDYLYFKDRSVPELKQWEDAVHWVDFFKPKTAIEVGCGMGGRVRALRRLGVEAVGFEISSWAVLNSPYRENDGHVWTEDLVNMHDTNTAPRDLVVAYDVLEHVEEEQLDVAINNLRNLTNKWVLVSIPFEGDPNLYNDHTHRIFRPRDWWIKQFSKHKLAVIPTPEHFNYKHQLLIMEKQ